ncbi:hypothetical protein [Patulibacter minatonensis]|uniref:hypothetical protein n=1 Tax=Patulibacter minatonensis TaxID=298163 RepID=UPI00047B6858|nr:hypothetical protein [Patulibacter minatonensis]
MSVPRRAVPAVVVLVALVVAAVVVVVARGDGGLPFRAGERESSRPVSGEGLLGRARAPRAAVGDTFTEADTPIVEYHGRGSLTFGYHVVRLREDAPAQRIRQLSSAQVLRDDPDPAVRWKGWVAPQRPRDELRPGEFAVDVVGSWRPAEGEGVLVRPGEMVRLRTRFDVSGRTTGPCSEVTFEDGPTWEVREDGSDGAWKLLRYRDRDPARDTVARTGMDGRISFRAGARCDRDTDEGTHESTVAIDGPLGE